MTSKHIISSLLVLSAISLFRSVHAAVVIDLPGYYAIPFANAVPNAGNLTVDSNGLLYSPSAGNIASNGITRFTSGGSSTLWSTALGYGLVIAPDGTGYLATGSPGDSILKLGADGSFTTLVPNSLSWGNLALSPSGTLFGNIFAGPGAGLYSINTITGAYIPVVSGTPGNGTGGYEGMTFGPDGNLYTIGFDYEGDSAVFALYRLDGNSLTRLNILPDAGIGLTVDPSGIFYTATSNGSGNTAQNEVWRIDVADGTTELLASGFGSPSGIAFDPTTDRLFVRDQDAPYQITAIVPEPSTCALLTLIVLGLLGIRIKRLKGYFIIFNHRHSFMTYSSRGQCLTL